VTGRHLNEIRDHPEFRSDWDVARDSDGWPVTITWEQVGAIWHAIAVVEAVRRAEGHESLYRAADGCVRDGVNYQTSAELAKSRLLGRMLVDGVPPTKTRPPRELGGPEWALLDGGDPFGGSFRQCRHCGGKILPVRDGESLRWVHEGGSAQCATAPVAEP
jgi:hypothetical protein